jgi:L-malate glycosyltransferase
MDKKLLLVIDNISNPHAGTEGQFLLLIDQLIGVGFEVQVIVLRMSRWLEVNTLPCPVHVLGVGSLKAPITWWRVYRIAQEFRQSGFGLAHIFFNDASVVCPPMFYLAGIKSIISRRDMGFWYNRLYRLLLPVTGKFVSAAVSNSLAVSAETAKVEKIPQSKLFVIYNGYQGKNLLNPIIEELEVLKKQNAFIFGLVANIRAIKRMQDAIEALCLVESDIQNPHLVIVGAGDPTELKLLAKERKVAERVHFLGGRDDVHECLRYFRAGLLCSESEGFSNAIIEYQFASLPVICTDTGGNPEAVKGGLGWLYPVGDVRGLAALLKAAMADPAAFCTIGEHAKVIAEQRYAVTTMRDEYIALYDRITLQ